MNDGREDQKAEAELKHIGDAYIHADDQEVMTELNHVEPDVNELNMNIDVDDELLVEFKEFVEKEGIDDSDNSMVDIEDLKEMNPVKSTQV